VEGEALLDRILENTTLLEPLRVELELSHEEISSVEAEPIASLERPSPKPLDLSYFEDEFLEDFGNTSKYSCQKRPPILVTPSDPLDDLFLRKSIKELIAIMSSKWVEEVELQSDEIQICTPSSTIRCSIGRTSIDVLYNPTV
jgi:hypothetical protein